MTTSPVFVMAPADLVAAAPGALIPVTGQEGRHGAAVRRLRVDESCHLVDEAGRRVVGRVASVGGDSFTVCVDDVLDEPAPVPRLVVVQALPKGDRADAAVEMLTECGVDEIIPWAAQRSVAVWRGEKRDRGVRRWQSVARAAAKQSRRSRTPTVTALVDSRDVARRLADASLGIVLHESATQSLADVVAPTDGDVVVVVGPEGGISDDERELFASAGARAVRLGPTVLRTSTAGVAALAVLSVRTGRWTSG